MRDAHTADILAGLRAPMWTCGPDADTERAAREWASLCAALDLDEHATAQGVVTEIVNLRAELAARGYVVLDGEPAEYEVAYG